MKANRSYYLKKGIGEVFFDASMIERAKDKHNKACGKKSARACMIEVAKEDQANRALLVMAATVARAARS